MSDGQKKINAESEVNTTALASVLGITARRVQQLAQDGTFIQSKRGRFPLGDSVQRFVRKKVDEVKSVADDEVVEAEKAKLVNEARLKEAKATVAQIEAEELKGTIHRAEDVEIITNDMIYTIRSALNALPGRLAVDVTGVSSPAEASEIIRREVHKVMAELAGYEYDKTKYEERVRERMEWELGFDGNE